MPFVVVCVIRSGPRVFARRSNTPGPMVLLDEPGWAEATEGCDCTQHVASPFPLQMPKNANTLIGPAVGEPEGVSVSRCVGHCGRS